MTGTASSVDHERHSNAGRPLQRRHRQPTERPADEAMEPEPGKRAPGLCNDDSGPRRRQRPRDVDRPRTDPVCLPPVPRVLLRHSAGRKPARTGQKPASEGRVSLRADPLHQDLHLCRRRNDLTIGGVVERTAGEEPHGHTAQVLFAASEESTSRAMPAVRIQRTAHNDGVEVAGSRGFIRGQHVHTIALPTENSVLAAFIDVGPNGVHAATM